MDLSLSGSLHFTLFFFNVSVVGFYCIHNVGFSYLTLHDRHLCIIIQLYYVSFVEIMCYIKKQYSNDSYHDFTIEVAFKKNTEFSD